MRDITETWLETYNTERPHDSLGQVPPLAFLPRPDSASKSIYETARLRWLTVAGSLIISVLSMEAAARAGVEWGPAIAFGIIGFAISMLLLGMFDWLKHL